LGIGSTVGTAADYPTKEYSSSKSPLERGFRGVLLILPREEHTPPFGHPSQEGKKKTAENQVTI
jgi:hypothetical protein